MIKWLKKKLGRKEKYEPEDFPRKVETKEEALKTEYTIYTIKVVWSDGSEDEFECIGYRLDANNTLEVKFLEDIRLSKVGGLSLRKDSNFKRFIDDKDRRYWEIKDKKSYLAKKTIKYEIEERLNSDNTSKYEHKKLLELQDGWDAIEIDNNEMQLL